MPEYVRENVWHKRLKIAVGQIDPTIGDFPGNIEKILAAVDEAQRLSCNLVVFPEMSLTGGPAHDLLLRPDFVKSQIAALKELVGRIGKIVALVGFVDRRAEGREVKLFNSAALIFDGSVRRVIDKTQMSEVDGFDERRYLTPGEPSAPLKLNGVPLGILIGDDVQRPDACKRLVKEGASLIIGLMSLSFRMGDFATRLSEMADVARNADVDVLVADLVRARGFPALTTRDAGRLRNTDTEQLAYAADRQMALLTHNRVHFEDLNQEYFSTGRMHCGILIAVRRLPHQIVRNLLVILNRVTADEMVNQIRYI